MQQKGYNIVPAPDDDISEACGWVHVESVSGGGVLRGYIFNKRITPNTTTQTTNLPPPTPNNIHDSHNHHNTTSSITFDGAIADAIETLKDEMPGGELALIVILVAGACFVLGGFAMWMFLRRRKDWRKCRRCERRKRERGKVVEDGGRVWYGREKGGRIKVSEEKRRRRESATESAAEEGEEEEASVVEYLSGIY